MVVVYESGCVNGSKAPEEDGVCGEWVLDPKNLQGR